MGSTDQISAYLIGKYTGAYFDVWTPGFVVIGTEADAEAKCLELNADGRRTYSWNGPVEFLIAIKP